MKFSKNIKSLLGLLILLSTSIPSNAWLISQPKSPQSLHPPTTSDRNGEFSSLGLSPAEVQLVLASNAALADYQHKPDCFRDSMIQVKSRCGQELEMNQQERVLAAIHLTKCEISTSHQTSPLECESIETNPEKAGNCVQALSRSAQFWSSYSGYLREVSQLCFAFRRWSEIDSAKSIYKEIVEQKKGLLEILKRQADIREKRDNEGWERMQKVGKEVEGVGDQWKESFKTQFEISERFKSLVQALEESAKVQQGILKARQNEETFNEMQSTFENSLIGFGNQLFQEIVTSSRDENLELVTLLTKHQKSSSEELNSFQQAITDLLSTSTSNLLTRLDHLDSTGDQIVSSSLSTSSSISSLRNNYDHLVSSLLKTENILSEQATSLETLKTSQLESTSQLSNLISGLTEFINHTDWNSRSRSGNNWNENISLKSFGMMSLRVLGFVESENSIGFRDQGFEVESWVGKVLLMIVESAIGRLDPECKTALLIKLSGYLLSSLCYVFWYLTSHFLTLVFLLLVTSSRRLRPLLKRLSSRLLSSITSTSSRDEEEREQQPVTRPSCPSQKIIFPTQISHLESSRRALNSQLQTTLPPSYPRFNPLASSQSNHQTFINSSNYSVQSIPPHSQRCQRGRRASSEPPVSASWS